MRWRIVITTSGPRTAGWEKPTYLKIRGYYPNWEEETDTMVT
jgi:hypothetical protein